MKCLFLSPQRVQTSVSSQNNVHAITHDLVSSAYFYECLKLDHSAKSFMHLLLQVCFAFVCSHLVKTLFYIDVLYLF